ncbi:MAG: M3 family oligoendopeptidase [Armatimonadetes bacterium]|nr:M3 family oligoendopeptidase [Armatimonadota bacterium]
MSSVTQIPYPKVRWDLSALFDGIEDPRIEETLSELDDRAGRFGERFRGALLRPGLDAATLLAGVRELEAIANDLSKPLTYANLLFSTDTGDAKSGAFLQRMMERTSEIQVKLMFFELELQALSEDAAARLLEDEGLERYRHWVKKARTFSPFRLSEAEEVLLEKTANTGSRAWVRLFEEVTSNHLFSLLRPGAEKAEEMSLQEVLDLFRSPERDVRQAAADALTEGLSQLERVLVFTFNNLLQDKKLEDDLRGYGYPEQGRHLSNELDKETVDLVVGQCVDNYGLVERFYNVKREVLGLPELTHIDRYAPLFDTAEKVEYDRAKGIVLDAFGRFSEELSSSAAEFFAENWIDAEPRKGKTGGAFCSFNTPDTHPVVLMSYMNKMDDVMTLAHELGHGVHASLMRNQTYLNFHPTLPMAELASTFGEMLVFDSLVQEASRRDRLALYAEKIENIFATVFRQAAMYRFEQACHVERREGGELTAEGFGELWQEHLQEMFGDSIKLGGQHSNWWSYVGHFIFAPFYVYAYSFGELLVLSLYQMAKREGPAFGEKFIRLLSLGGSRSPQELMDVVGVDLKRPEFWQGGFDVIENMVAEFERLWQEERRPGGES